MDDKPKDKTLGLKITIAVLSVAVVILAIIAFWPSRSDERVTDSSLAAANSSSEQESVPSSSERETTAAAEASSEEKEPGQERSSNESVSEESEPDTTRSETTPDEDVSKESETPGTDSEAAQGEYLLTYSAGNGWESGGAKMCTMEFSLRNQTKETVKNWVLVMTVEGLMNVEGWNGTYEIKGDTLKVTPADYNAEIFENGTVYLGCNIGTKEGLEISAATLNGIPCIVKNGYVNQNEQNNPGGGNQNPVNDNNGAASVDTAELLKRADGAKQGDDWLHTDGHRILDKDGKEVWLTGVNWFGYNTGTNTFDGLWNSKMEPTVKAIADHGFNLIRVPFSAQLINQWAAGEYPRANFNQAYNVPMTKMNSLEIFEYFLSLAEANGLKVMIDIHSAETDAAGHNVNLWYTGRVTTEQYYAALEWMADRYKNNDTIIAYDLKNEPHGKPNEGDSAAIWNNTTKANNWKYVAETAASKVLAKNPNVLILVEGTEIYPKNNKGDYSSSNSDDYYFNWWGGNLRAVKDFPINLGKYQDKLVYSPHDYGPTVYQQPWFQKDYTYDSLMKDCWHDNWFYIYEDNTAPLLIGEWGGFMREPNLTWMTHMRSLISTYHLHHTFWCLNANSGDTGGLLLDDFTTWDNEKYAFVKEVLWQENGKFVGLDHEIPLGDNGITLKAAKGLK